MRTIKIISCIIFGISLLSVNLIGQADDWKPLGPFFDRVDIDNMVQDKNNNYLYLVTGNDIPNTIVPRKIYRSKDFGITWTEISRIYNRHVYELDVHPDDPSRLYINSHSRALYFSNDSGFTWEHYNPGIIIKDVLFDTTNLNTLLAVGETYENNEQHFSFLKSENNGESWTTVEKLDLIPGHVSAKAIMDPKNRSKLYAYAKGHFDGAQYPDPDETRIYRSLDYGASWTTVYSSIGRERISVLEIDPDSTNIIYYLTGDTLYQSKNSGDTWDICLTDTTQVEFMNLSFHPQHKDTVYLGTTRGLRHSYDRGKSWHKNEFCERNWDTWTGIHSKNTDTMFYAARDTFYLSKDNGNTWETNKYDIRTSSVFDIALTSSQDSMYIINEFFTYVKAHTNNFTADGLMDWYFLPWFMGFFSITDSETDALDPNTVYFSPSFSGNQSGTHRSTDGGYTWTKIDSSMRYVKCIYSYTDGSLYLGGRDNLRRMTVYLSSDKGDNWIKHRLHADGEVLTIEVDPKNSDIIYAGGFTGNEYEETTRGRLYKTYNAGESWQRQARDITPIIRSIQIDPFRSNIVYLGTDEGFYKSTDSGENWQLYASDFTKVRKVICDSNHFGILYLAAQEGVFKSKDGGETWQEMNNGLSETDILCLEYQNISRTLYAGTNSEGVYYLNVTDTSEIDIPLSTIRNEPISESLTVYPNPLRGTATIQFDLEKPSIVSLKIYNISGREITTLINQTLSSGNHRINWNAENIAPGIYLMKLETNNNITVKKLIVKE